MAFFKKFRDAQRPCCAALVAAAGSSSRMGGVNKLLQPLDGIPVLARTLTALQMARRIDEIVVASREEALGVPVDFMGAPMFFPDLAHNVVYMKRFNTNSGAADVFEFKLDVPREKQQQAPAQVAAFAPLDEFIDMKDTVQNLKDEVDRLKKPAGKAVKKNDASDE